MADHAQWARVADQWLDQHLPSWFTDKVALAVIIASMAILL